ncbi:MAG: N-ethylammeline chlorohydrolase [Gammaproteobacteria bacterium]|nr:MAG: N-ethylammeline chlorohydrolase [Gammaproteobacteria bacterium]
MEAEAIDLLVEARWVIPVVPRAAVLEDHAVAVRGGRILEILPAAEARRRYRAERVVQRPDHALIPGLVNAHTHAAMTLFRGLADDRPLMVWLQEHIWPAEQKWVDERFVLDGTRLAAAEMIKGGTTCFADMYFFPDAVAEVARSTGLRAAVGLIVLDFPTVWAQDPDEYLSKGAALHDKLRAERRLYTFFAPHAPYTVSDAPLEKLGTLAEELDIPIMIHLHETAGEVDEAVAREGRRPFARLDALGLVSPRLMAVHMTQLEPAEIARLAETGAHVVHCPESNLKLASGFCPVQALLEAGVNVALGTDGAASNNDLDLIGEMRTAALLAKAVSGDAAAVPAAQALEMATLGGARALGLDGEIGSLEPGKWADLVAVDLGVLESQPVYDPLSHLVYCTQRNQVSDVWVAGRPLLQNRALVDLDEGELIACAEGWRARIAGP